MSAHGIRGFVIAMLLGCVLIRTTSAQEGEGTVRLGAGFTGRPFGLGGDIILETDGVWNCLRDYGAAGGPAWIGWQLGGGDGGLWREVLWDDGLAAVLRDEFNEGVQFVDFSDPAAPVTLGVITGTTYAAGLLRDRLLFLATQGLVIVYDVTAPANPAFRFAKVLPAQAVARSFCTASGLVYFVEHDAVVHVVDASDPVAVADLGVIDLGAERVDALAAAPGALYALVATETAPEVRRIELVTFDVAAPLAPVETDRRALATGPGARGLTLQRNDDLLLASENQAATHAFDIAAVTQPVPGFTLPIAAERVVIAATRILAFAGEELQVHERTPAAGAPVLLSVRRVLPELRRLAGTGPVLWAQPEKDHSLLIPVDAADPTHPRLGSEFETGLDGEFVLHDDMIVMVAGDDLQIIDVHDPSLPVLRGTLRLTSRVSGLGAALDDGIIALEADAAGAVDLVDLRDADHPRQAARIPDRERPLAIGGDIALLLAGDQIHLHEIGDPDQPVDHGPLPVTGTPLAAAVAGPRAYCLTGPPLGILLHVLDITDPAAAQVIATCPLEASGSLTHAGNRLYVTGSQRVQIIDVARPDGPVVAAWYEPAFPAAGRLGVSDDLVVTGTNLTVARDITWRPTAVAAPPAPPAAALLTARPNPFNPRTTVTFELSRAGHATLTVHDLRGRRLATLASGTFPAGTHRIPWSAVDANDRPLPSGTYLLHLQTPTTTTSLPTTLLK